MSKLRLLHRLRPWPLLLAIVDSSLYLSSRFGKQTVSVEEDIWNKGEGRGNQEELQRVGLVCPAQIKERTYGLVSCDHGPKSQPRAHADLAVLCCL